MHGDNCPSDDDLRQFAVGKVLSRRRFAGIDAHLGECSSCLESVQAFDDQGDKLIGALRREAFSPNGALNSNGLPLTQRVLAAIHDIRSESDAATGSLAVRETQARGGSTWPSEGPLREQGTVRPGDRIGNYQIIDRLGDGGMGVVYRAMHCQLQRQVALKVVRSDRLNTDMLERFVRERKAIGRLSHPGIVSALDAGEAGGSHYLAMELLDGVDLSALAVRRHSLPAADACEIIRQAAVALQFAHDRGWVHRDIKPSNLMLCWDRATESGGQAAIVKLLDLGLSRLSLDRDCKSSLTAGDQVLGTIDYMAPEQALDSRAADARSDVYSLGATLYRLLAGCAPRSGQDFQTPGQKFLALLTEPTPSLAQYGRDLPHALIDVVDRMLSREPNARYESPRQVAAALAPFTAGHDLVRLLRDAQADEALSPAPQLDGDSAVATVKPNPTAWQSTPTVAARGGGTTFPWRVALACGGAAVLLLAAVILLLPTKDGATIQLEIDDPQLKISVADGEYTIDDNGQQIKLSVGDHALSVRRGELQFEAATFMLKRGDVVRLKVSYLDDKVFLARDGNIQELRAVQPLASREPAPAALPPWPPTAEQQAYFDAVALLSGDARIASVIAKLRDLAGYEESTRSAHFDPQWQMREGKAVSFQTDAWTVSKVWPLVALRELESLDLVGTTVTDFRPLTKLPLVDLNVELALFNIGAEETLREIPTLKSINGVAAKDFFARRVEQRAEIDEFARRAKAANLPLPSIFEWAEPRMRHLNPDMSKKASFAVGFIQPGDPRISFDNGSLLIWCGGEIRDLSALRVFPLERIKLHGQNSQGGPHLFDLSPLAGLPISEITLHGTPLSDLSPLREMPLEKLSIAMSMVEDLSPLAGSKLESLDCAMTRVADLSPLKDLPLVSLDISRTRVRGLSPLSGMQLTTLLCDETDVTDLAPLAGMPIQHLSIARRDGTPVADLAPLANMPLESINLNLRIYFDQDEEVLRRLPLKSINGKPPAAFWETVQTIRAERQSAINSIAMMSMTDRTQKVAELMVAEGMRVEFQVEDGEVTTATIGRYGNHAGGSPWPLLALPELRRVILNGVQPRLDLSPLTRLKVESITIESEPADEAALIALNRPILRAITSLKRFNGQPATAHLFSSP